MSEFKSLKNLGKKDKTHRTRIGDQTSNVSARQIEARKDVTSVGSRKSKKTTGPAPDRKTKKSGGTDEVG